MVQQGLRQTIRSVLSLILEKSPMALQRHVGFRSGMSVSDEACRGLRNGEETIHVLGLGSKENMNKIVFLPNIPSVTSMLFKIKHLVKITPVTFPHGIPEDFHPDSHGYNLNKK